MSEVKQEQGNLSINSENLFPIIKKWLYSDHDIFFRELISNGCDAGRGEVPCGCHCESGREDIEVYR